MRLARVRGGLGNRARAWRLGIWGRRARAAARVLFATWGDFSPRQGRWKTPTISRAQQQQQRRAETGGTDTQGGVPRRSGAQLAFKDLMTHGVVQFALRIAFRCVLHRGGNQDIRCQELFLVCLRCMLVRSQRGGLAPAAGARAEAASRRGRGVLGGWKGCRKKKWGVNRFTQKSAQIVV